MRRRAILLAPAAAAFAAYAGRKLSTSNTATTTTAPAPAPAPSTTTTTTTTTTSATAPQTTTAPAPAPATTGIDVLAEIKALRIMSGPYTGGYEIAPNGRLNWYFSALGLMPVVQFLSAADLDFYVREYLDLYLRCLNDNLSIDDVDFPVGRADPSYFVKVLSDSDDSYAATFLSLAARYLRASGNRAWWDANKSRLKDLAYRNLALTLKPNGLTSVFQAPRNASNSIGYLMDNCEVYRGLRDFASALRDCGDADAVYYDSLATSITVGISTLYQVGSSAFVPGDAYLAPEASFYAGTTCQVFPQAFGVTECAAQFDAAWAYLNRFSPTWEDGRYDTYPWAILGYVAAKRGQAAQARTQMATVENLFSLSRARVTINELGFYLRARNLLEGRADV